MKVVEAAFARVEEPAGALARRDDRRAEVWTYKVAAPDVLVLVDSGPLEVHPEGHPLEGSLVREYAIELRDSPGEGEECVVYCHAGNLGVTVRSADGADLRDGQGRVPEMGLAHGALRLCYTKKLGWVKIS